MTVEIYLKALDSITKLLPFLKSFTGERRREYFEKLVKPLFESLEDIHDFYNELFLETRKQILLLRITNTPFLSSEPQLSLEALQELEKIKQDFLDSRSKDEALRDSLRYDAQEDYQTIRWLEERRFLTSIVYYFLGIGGISPTDSELDNAIESVIEKGGNSYWPTPSMRLYLDIKESRDPDYIIETLDQARARLNQAYMNVRKQFRRVQNAIVMKT